ncbi:MAG: hypothetical protein NTZ69_14420 [Bacteroidia bacterium]|nr:hypothetical protein [Bacteroidia bacterium]
MTTKKILIAEDNKLILDTVVFKLQKEGYEVTDGYLVGASRKLGLFCT